MVVERLKQLSYELPGELSIESSSSNDSLTVAYGNEPIARYLPTHEIAELNVHLVVDETKHGDTEPHKVTEALIEALEELEEREFEICHHHAESMEDDQYRQILVLRHGSIAEAELVELISLVLEASRYAINFAMDQEVALSGPD